MILYRQPGERRRHYRVDVPNHKPAQLLLGQDTLLIPLENLSAGGFALKRPRDWGLFFKRGEKPGEEKRFSGILSLRLDDHKEPVRVPMEFQVIAEAGQPHCEIVSIKPDDRAQLFTYVFEVDRETRLKAGQRVL